MIGIMPRRWTAVEEAAKRIELIELHEPQNRSIGDIAALLGRSEVTIYQRLRRLGIPVRKERKPGYLRARVITLPPVSGDLAESCAIMLGDGHIGPGQLWVSVNARTDLPYAAYVQDLFEKLFSFRPRLTPHRAGTVDLYLTSASLVRALAAVGSLPLLAGARQALLDLGFHPSRVSSGSVYLTRRGDIRRYIQEIGFGNAKQRLRATAFGLRPPSRQAP